MIALRDSKPASGLTITQTAEARQLQRRGLTFTEIAAQLELPREHVEAALYWNLHCNRKEC